MQIFDAPRKITDVVANTVVEKVFDTKSLDVILDIQSDHLEQLADATPNTKLPCICESESSYKFGFCSNFQCCPGLEAAGVKELLSR